MAGVFEMRAQVATSTNQEAAPVSSVQVGELGQAAAMTRQQRRYQARARERRAAAYSRGIGRVFDRQLGEWVPRGTYVRVSKAS